MIQLLVGLVETNIGMMGIKRIVLDSIMNIWGFYKNSLNGFSTNCKNLIFHFFPMYFGANSFVKFKSNSGKLPSIIDGSKLAWRISMVSTMGKWFSIFPIYFGADSFVKCKSNSGKLPSILKSSKLAWRTAMDSIMNKWFAFFKIWKYWKNETP